MCSVCYIHWNIYKNISRNQRDSISLNAIKFKNV